MKTNLKEIHLEVSLRLGENKCLFRSKLKSEPTIRSCDTGQGILCFNSCQLTTTCMCNISHSFLFGADEQAGGRTSGHWTTKIYPMDG